MSKPEAPTWKMIRGVQEEVSRAKREVKVAQATTAARLVSDGFPVKYACMVAGIDLQKWYRWRKQSRHEKWDGKYVIRVPGESGEPIELDAWQGVDKYAPDSIARRKLLAPRQNAPRATSATFFDKWCQGASLRELAAQARSSPPAMLKRLRRYGARLARGDK